MKLPAPSVFLCALTVASLVPQCLGATTVYVDGRLSLECSSGAYSIERRDCSGEDATAYPSIQEATENLESGTSILVRGGTYKEAVRIRDVEASADPVSLSSFMGEEVVVDGTGLEADALILIESSSGVKLTDLNVRNAQTYGIKARNSSDVEITNCEVSWARHGGIVFEDSSRVTIRGSRVNFVNLSGTESWHEGISLGNVDTFEVVGCQVSDSGKEGIVAKYGSRNGQIHRNSTFRNNGPNIYLDGVSQIKVHDNLIHSVTSEDKPGLGVAVEAAYNRNRNNTSDLHIYNNVIYGNAAGITFWIEDEALSWARISNVRIENNTIHDNNKANWGAIFILNGSAENYPSGNTIRNNVLVDNTQLAGAKSIRDDAGVVGTFQVDHNLFRRGEPSDSFGTQPVMVSTPGFEEESDHDYRLRESSPATDSGVEIEDIGTDCEGRLRPSGGSYDIGAFEWIARSSTAEPWRYANRRRSSSALVTERERSSLPPASRSSL